MSTTTTQKSSYSREDLLACAHGELFGPGNARLPLPNMLMMDRITHISDQGGKYGKGESSPNWISARTSGSLIATSKVTR